MDEYVLKSKQKSAGFSVVELLVVLAIIGIMSGLVLFYATVHKKLYQPDDQALQIADVLQEARQRSLTQRRPMRVEINRTINTVKLYDENTNATSASDDVLLKTHYLFSSYYVKLDSRPSEITVNPPEVFTVPNAVFKTSTYPTSISQNVCTVRFLANGTAVDAGTNAIGTGAVPTSVTLHIWAPKKDSPNESDIARSLTIIGSTGVIRMWEYDHTSTAANKWKDSRRTTSYATGN